MLVLLIIFMVAAPMMNDMVDVTLPKAQAKNLGTDEKNVTLSIKKDNKLFIGKTEIKFDELSQKLTAIFENRSKKEVFLNADEEVMHGFIVQVMASIQRAGIYKIAFLTDPSK
ncbi:MAG: protein TolR [Deltaproteobacteria bacterium CG11_big_fil_rev_8_21_14_0_20_45_16]|nr:MAG: protein TolR [Deltaproteobacteria bacterium CG11_big_fil_rev_8_21_14_0_20_45_16]